VVFLDINTFYSPKAGGIRTYHQAKIEWFKRRPGHHYILVYPGPAYRVREEHPHVTLVEVFGPALTGDPAGYRLILDYWRVYRLIRKTRPDVLEAGDPWLTGLFCLALKKLGLFRGRLAAFYHSDPVPTYFAPWAERGFLRPLKRLLLGPLAAFFYGLQKGYGLTAVSSRAMEESLRACGIARTAHLPFGVPALFLETPPPRRAPGPRRLLYAGRLDREKGIEALLFALPSLLALGNVEVTVVGRGAFADRFAAFGDGRLHYLGFVDGPRRMLEIYDGSHALLAPGPFETFGLGVLEAMARGLVVIGPDRGGTAELLREAESPFMFRAGDERDFLRAAAAALGASDSEWEALAARSRATAERYGTWDEAVGRMVARHTGDGA
jgi:alpha-1,6-mannosyltransferase